MARYACDIFPLQCSHRDAKTRLTALSDEELVQRFRNARMFRGNPDLPLAAFRADEPEHEFLGANIRAQLARDLDVAYHGDPSGDCDDILARQGIGVEHGGGLSNGAFSNGGTLPYPVLVSLLDTYDDGDASEDDYYEEREEQRHRFEYANPVQRLRTAAICGPVVAATQPTVRVTVDDLTGDMTLAGRRAINDQLLNSLTTQAYRTSTLGVVELEPNRYAGLLRPSSGQLDVDPEYDDDEPEFP